MEYILYTYLSVSDTIIIPLHQLLIHRIYRSSMYIHYYALFLNSRAFCTKVLSLSLLFTIISVYQGYISPRLVVLAWGLVSWILVGRLKTLWIAAHYDSLNSTLTDMRLSHTLPLDQVALSYTNNTANVEQTQGFTVQVAGNVRVEHRMSICTRVLWPQPLGNLSKLYLGSKKHIVVWCCHMIIIRV